MKIESYLLTPFVHSATLLFQTFLVMGMSIEGVIGSEGFLDSFGMALT